MLDQSITLQLLVLHAPRSRQLVQHAFRSHPPGDLRAAVPRRRADRGRPDGSSRCFAAGCFKASGNPEAGRAGARPSRRSPDALQRAAWRPGPADQLDKPDGRVLAKPVRPPRRPAQKDGPVNEPASDPLSVEADASEKARVNWNMWIRQTHRWLSITFT